MSAEKRDGPSNNVRPPAAPVRFDRFELDEANACFLRDGKAVPLAPTPFAVLCALVRQPGSLLTKQALLDDIWGHQYVSESVLKTVISDLRTLLEDDARQPRFIETVSRRGYRFIATTATAAPHLGTETGKLVALQAKPLVGRREALARLHATWDHARAGKRSIVWVAFAERRIARSSCKSRHPKAVFDPKDTVTGVRFREAKSATGPCRRGAGTC